MNSYTLPQHTFSYKLPSVKEVEKKLGYTFKQPALLKLAFTHRSYANEHRDAPGQNERLEFLGDSVLGLIVTEFLYLRLPRVAEGTLSQLRSRIVDSDACCRYMKTFDAEAYLLLGKGEELNWERSRDSILADLFEATIAAIYLDGGLEAVRAFFFGHFEGQIEALVENPPHNWKALLQDWTQREYQQTPRYKTIEESGPDHKKHFVVVLLINNKEIARGEGHSKKDAQSSAAKDAIKVLGVDVG